MIVWQDQRYIAPTVFFQRFNFLSQPLGTNLKVNPNIDTAQTPCIKVNSNGNFTVSWTDRSNSRIVARMFDGNGIPTSPITLVSDSNYSNTSPKIDSDKKGNFLIVWENYSISTGESVLLQRFTSDGLKLGYNENISDIGVNSRKSNPGISVRPDGSFIICWSSADCFQG